eukprot:CAMPEP_0175069926 /NCGR_PEP_ID=MMETSP0052_2-20121109/18447_1 /TAXON_ID=51329 ORGANISM="Polytomella parva, Strain SAG 63-3" /NCGR_SAMPLE_ID=MMETSP0052_2 /ASSEMBLY_ACC=CAM_ASM_000194 /LENGTH=301 /DNA_ID=CAMNT_0016337017 /DNA_START=288 /DNA_END=1190 /DNA_ORIENTATION=+
MKQLRSVMRDISSIKVPSSPFVAKKEGEEKKGRVMDGLDDLWSDGNNRDDEDDYDDDDDDENDDENEDENGNENEFARLEKSRKKRDERKRIQLKENQCKREETIAKAAAKAAAIESGRQLKVREEEEERRHQLLLAASATSSAQFMTLLDDRDKPVTFPSLLSRDGGIGGGGMGGGGMGGAFTVTSNRKSSSNNDNINNNNNGRSNHSSLVHSRTPSPPFSRSLSPPSRFEIQSPLPGVNPTPMFPKAISSKDHASAVAVVEVETAERLEQRRQMLVDRRIASRLPLNMLGGGGGEEEEE